MDEDWLIYWDVYTTREEAKRDYLNAKKKIERLSKFNPVGYKIKKMSKPKKYKDKIYNFKLYIKVK